MTLASREVRTWLEKHAVCGWTNIEDTDYAGKSNRHHPGDSCKTINNGAGARNVQSFIMTANGRVLNCMPGYWSPADWLAEAELAAKLALVATDKTLSIAERNEKFLAAHLERISNARPGIEKESQLQPFDKPVEAHRNGSDFVRAAGLSFGHGDAKSVYQVFHERMAERPFVAFERFDIGKYVEMGGEHYSYHLGR